LFTSVQTLDNKQTYLLEFAHNLLLN